MSETRYSPAQLDERARSMAWLGNDSNRTEASAEFYRGAASMLRQAASDARVIAQLREWLERGKDSRIQSAGDFYDGLRQGIANTLMELDSLNHPAEEAEKP